MTVIPNLLEEVPAGTEILRNVRYLPDEAFDPYTDEELERAIRWFHAASYSATEGARRITRYLNTKRTETEPCASTSPTTARSGTTARPTDALPAPDPQSSSNNPTTPASP